MTGNDNAGFGAGADIASSIVSIGAGLYDSHQNRKVARENTDKTIAAQKAEAELAYQRSIEMWNMQNLYNSPEAQMNRFKAAGLNPHLIYGQGNAGNASGTPEYQPANLQYRYEAPAYGAAINSAIPTLMAVGTWMQNMRLSEAELQQKSTNTEKARQLIEFLEKMNPNKLSEIENRLSLYPYQAQAQKYNMAKGAQELASMQQEYRYRYGEDLFNDRPWPDVLPSSGYSSGYGGVRRLEFLEQEAKTRLEQAKASWTDFGITSPQAIIQMVLGGVMGMAGQTLKATPRPRIFKGGSSSKAPKRIKTFYDKGKRRSQVVDY